MGQWLGIGELQVGWPGRPTCEHGELDVTPVQISRKGVDRLAGGHPWVFRSDVVSAGEAEAGELVHVLDARGRFLGQAHYSTSSQIALRMLSRSVEAVDLGARIAAAQRFRAGIAGTTAYRLVHAEADFLPALIIDRYAECFTVHLIPSRMISARRCARWMASPAC